MKYFKVKATRDFKDLLEGVQRKAGDIWNCTKERYEFLKEHNAVELIEVLEEVKPEVVEEVETNDSEPETFVGYTQVMEDQLAEKVTIKAVKNKKSKKKGK